eukprot:6459231-Alexandrium_andersonii.AAC.1
MLVRYREFWVQQGGASADSFLDPLSVLSWFTHVKTSGVGRYTLSAGLRCFKFFGHTFQFEENISGCEILKRIASDWEAEAHAEPQRAKAFSRRFLLWLEMVVLDRRRRP